MTVRLGECLPEHSPPLTHLPEHSPPLTIISWMLNALKLCVWLCGSPQDTLSGNHIRNAMVPEPHLLPRGLHGRFYRKYCPCFSCSVIHSVFKQPFIFFRSFIHSFIHWSIQTYIYSPMHSYTYSFTHSLIHLSNHSITYYFIHLFSLLSQDR